MQDFGRSRARVGRFRLSSRFVFHDVASNSAGRDRKRAGQVHEPGSAAAREVAVLRADHHLIRPRGNSRAGIDARSATGLDDARARFLEYFEVALANAVFARLLRPKLDVELTGIRNAPALLQRFA